MITLLINLLTFTRIIAAFIIFALLALQNYYLLALGLFFIAGLTDYADGYLARKYNASSQMGEILDPIADKILIIFLLFGLALNLSSYLIGFAGALIITREIWVSALRDYNSRNNNLNTSQIYTLGVAPSEMFKEKADTPIGLRDISQLGNTTITIGGMTDVIITGLQDNGSQLMANNNDAITNGGMASGGDGGTVADVAIVAVAVAGSSVYCGCYYSNDNNILIEYRAWY